MKNHPLVPDDIEQNYDVREWRNGLAILAAVRPGEWAEMLEVLRGFKLLRSDIVNPGGSKSDIAKKNRWPFHEVRLVGEAVRYEDSGG